MNKNKVVVILVLLTFFVISFITNILGSIFPALIESFDIGFVLAGFFPFSFFISYGLMSVPSGMLVHKFGEKRVILSAFILSFLGASLFSFLPSFSIAMCSLFLIGCAMSMLQVAINPLLRASGGSENFAFLSVSAQLLFGLAGVITPLVYSNVIQEMSQQTMLGNIFNALVPSNMMWLSMYWVFAAISLLMIIIVLSIPIQNVKKTQDELTAPLQVYPQLLKQPVVIKFFFAIVCYVAVEQGIANSISLFLQQYHGLEPNTIGAAVVSDFWLALTFGCLLGLVLLNVFDAKHVLIAFSLLAMLSFSGALFGSAEICVIAFPAIGFFLSIMWSVLFSLVLNSLPKDHGSFSGILCTGILGGAIAYPVIGLLAEFFDSLRIGMLIILVPLIYIFSVGIWANPLVKNQRIQFSKSKKIQTV